MPLDPTTSAPTDDAILDALRRAAPERLRAKDLARRMGLRGRDSYLVMRDRLDALVLTGKVRQTGDSFAAARLDRDRTGTFGRLTVHPQGFGFVTVEGVPDDYFVRAAAMGSALDGDTVELTVRALDRDDRRRFGPGSGQDTAQRREAVVARVVERGRSSVVGTFEQRGAGGSVRPDDVRVTRSVWVREGDTGGATDGDKVVTSIADYGEQPDDSLRGTVLQVLGRADDPAVRVLALALAHGIRADFPDEVEREAAAISDTIPEAEIARRRDFRQTRVFTIDPVDAKDFDDAIHVVDNGDGTVEVGVHIADVSHYVQEGSMLDQEAFLRATSTYLVDRVIPMLPEHLSNGVCSLVPRQDRLVFSCVMQIRESDGEVVGAEFFDGVIHSHERFSYEGAQAILDGAEDHPMADDLRLANRVAEACTARRMKDGAIDFDKDEVKIVLDENGHAVGVVRKVRQATNRLIEAFMLEANRAAATRFRTRPFVYRIHDVPDADRIGALADYVKPFGLRLPLTNGTATSKDLGALLSQVKGSGEQLVVTMAALRAMAKARYSARNVGHFGLAFGHYTHFTSPIRRYPDLMVHRLARRYLAGGPDADEAVLEDRCAHCSIREREAEEAERESVKLKQVEYLQDRIGEAFDGIVTGVAKFGAFVEISDVLAEGLLHVRDLTDDRYDVDPRRMALVGRYEGRIFRPGTAVRVVVVKADVDTREINLVLAEDGGPPNRRRGEEGDERGGTRHIATRGARHKPASRSGARSGPPKRGRR